MKLLDWCRRIQGWGACDGAKGVLLAAVKLVLSVLRHACLREDVDWTKRWLSQGRFGMFLGIARCIQ